MKQTNRFVVTASAVQTAAAVAANEIKSIVDVDKGVNHR